MSRLLLWLSGVDLEVLKRCPSERNKFIGVGGAVLTTAVLAATACTLTLSNFIGIPWTIALPVGLLWGLAIMNLDRWLVASTKRQDTAWRTILMAIPRILLAVVIGLVIAEPLVLKVFDSEISEEAKVNQVKAATINARSLDETRAKITQLKEERQKLQTQLADLGKNDLSADPQYKKLDDELAYLRGELGKAQQAVIEEQEGKSASGKEGDGPASAEKRRKRDDLQEQVNRKQDEVNARRDQVLAEAAATQGPARERLEKDIATKDDEIASAEENERRESESLAQANDREIGVLDRMEALETLTVDNGSLKAANWTLRLFILALDSLPVLVKTLMLLGKPSLYDLELDEYERQQLEIERARTDAMIRARTMETEVIVDEAQARRDLEAQAARDLAFEIVEAQKDLARHYIAAWKERAAEQMDQWIEQQERIDVRQAPDRRAPRAAPAASVSGSGAARRAPGNGRPPSTNGGAPTRSGPNGAGRSGRQRGNTGNGSNPRQGPPDAPLPPFPTR